MNIIGPDFLLFGVDDMAACVEYFLDYGLTLAEQDEHGATLVALDGTGVILRHRDDPSLPPALATGSTLRQQIYGVASAEVLDAIEAELATDRRVLRRADGALETHDNHGFALKFQVTVRKTLDVPAEKINSPGAPPQRAPNEIGVWEQMPAQPLTLSHVVLFVPDVELAAAFYKRLGFVFVDELVGAGPFLRPAGNDDHHTLFFIRTPPYMQGCEHLAFHMRGPTELLLAGTRFVRAGYESFWGPGRHKYGSNWFWYFNSPLGCHVEYDADMDKHDDTWTPRATPVNAEASQVFLFQYREKWFPSGGPE